MKKEETRLESTKKQGKLFLRLLLGLLIIPIFLLNACTSAPEEPETYKVGVVNLAPVLEPIYEGFQEGLVELGYVEGENITYVYNGPVGDVAGLDAAVQELVDADVDLILSLSTPASLAAVRVTQEVPIVFAPIPDPQRQGLVSSISNPDGNATGVQWGVSEPRRLEWLLTLVPDIQRIYLPYNPDDGAAVFILGDIQVAAEQMGLELVLREARDTDEITEAIAEIPDDVDAIFLLPDSLLVSRMTDFAEAANALELPLTAPGDSTVNDGGLMTYSMAFLPIGKQAARMADQILKGTPVSEVPVETAELFLNINLKTAEAINVDIPEDILRQAHTIIRE